MNKLLSISILILIPSFIMYSQCFEENKTTTAGEYLEYMVSYQWGIIWIEGGMVNFMTDSTIYNGKPAYHFISTGKSLRAYNWIYKVRDRYESYADPCNLKPFFFTRKLKEGSYRAENSYHFDYNKNNIFSSIKDNKRNIHDTIPVQPYLYDVLTATYATRNINFEKHTPNDTIPIHFILDNNIIELKIRYLGKETVTHNDGKNYPCLKFTSTMIESSLFAKGEPLVVYVTDDKNKIPLLIVAELIIGSVKVYLKNARGLRHKGIFQAE